MKYQVMISQKNDAVCASFSAAVLKIAESGNDGIIHNEGGETAIAKVFTREKQVRFLKNKEELASQLPEGFTVF